VIAETKPNAPVAVTTIPAPVGVAAPQVVSSSATTSVSTAPVTGGVAVLASPAAPEVGTVAVPTGAATPSASATVAAPTTTSAPSSTNVAAGTKVSTPVAATTIPAPVGVAAPQILSSSATTTVSTAPVTGGVAVLASPAAPEVGTVAAATSAATPVAGAVFSYSEVARSPKSAKVSPRSQIAGPTAGQLTIPSSTTVSTKNAPIGATTIHTSVGESLAAVPMKTVQAVAHKKFRLPSTVLFGFDDATLTEEGKAAITDVVTTITSEKGWYVLRVDGFTDSLGSDDYNIKLGLRRAISVASYMVTNNGIDPSILFVKSSGEYEPIATNETEEGRSLNRRAEIVLFIQKEE
jgi:outer membrane protein OmpA-like peptidoglycan-associated protein